MKARCMHFASMQQLRREGCVGRGIAATDNSGVGGTPGNYYQKGRRRAAGGVYPLWGAVRRPCES